MELTRGGPRAQPVSLKLARASPNFAVKTRVK
jgi:hypothetical protein